MGGDRDGNPNVTADITRHVLLLSRWKATDLFLKDIQFLISELSMVDATPELLALVGEEGAAEPYRYLMKTLRSRLMATRARWKPVLKARNCRNRRDFSPKTNSSGTRCMRATSLCRPVAWALSPMANCSIPYAA